jgi:FlaA1/EpsC-like NDP-sugar epimerase
LQPVRRARATIAHDRIDRSGRRSPLYHLAVDAFVWVIALPITALLRFDFEWASVSVSGTAIAGAVAITWQGSFGYMVGLYDRRWRYGSFDEVRALATTVLLTGGLLTAIAFMLRTADIPRSVPVLATGFTMTGTIAMRSVWRLYKDKRNRPHEALPIVMIGAGEGSYQISRALLTDSSSSYEPVALLDDDPNKRNLRFQSLRVEGTLDDLQAVAHRHHARHVLMAIPSADSRLIARMAEVANLNGLTFLVLPPPAEMLGIVATTDIRSLTPADLLGRLPAEIDTHAVAHSIAGKRVLVTGAGGSIGSELCRQLHALAPSALIMLDRDESGLHAVQLSISGHGLLDDPNLVLADIRDRDRVYEVFRTYRPEVVFHAAALKHLPLLQSHPMEGWQTNVVGTENVLDAATAVGVQRLLNISTDKAANPTSVLGWTKRITERLTANQAAVARYGSYISVRFGNVLGSRGSVLEAFSAQSSNGGPITVTHPEVARYFMTVEEAVRLTIYAAAIGSSGEALVLDMGAPVKILDVARRFAQVADPPLPIVFTGLRPGEKLREDRLATDETDDRRVHPLISHVAVPPLALSEAERTSAGCDATVLELMQRLSTSVRQSVA